MRLWSLHPSLLDTKGLVALWREALLAQQVLYEKTKGYRHHPQLRRFYDCDFPKTAIAVYLSEVHKEARRRGYEFNRDKILANSRSMTITVTDGQMDFELHHLKVKLLRRDTKHLLAIERLAPKPHPLFEVVSGPIQAWERV